METQLTWQTWMAATAKFSFRIKKILSVNTIFAVSFFIQWYFNTNIILKSWLIYHVFHVLSKSDKNVHKDMENTNVFLCFTI